MKQDGQDEQDKKIETGMDRINKGNRIARMDRIRKTK